MVRIPPGTVHEVIATGDVPLKLLIVYSPPLPQRADVPLETGCRSMNRPVAAPHIGDPGALEALYRRFLDDPHDVPRDWARYFAQLGEADPQVAAAPPGETGSDAADALRAASLLGAWRRYGHLAARLDPLGLAETPGHPALDPARHGLPADDPRHQALREIYGGTTGFEIDHIGDYRAPRLAIRACGDAVRAGRCGAAGHPGDPVAGGGFRGLHGENASPPRSASASRAGTALSLHLKPFLR